jgi:hypothetical protein
MPRVERWCLEHLEHLECGLQPLSRDARLRCPIANEWYGMLIATQPRDSIVANTWAALVLVCDYRGRIVLRAMRGSVFARAVRQSLLDMQLYGMSG